MWYERTDTGTRTNTNTQIRPVLQFKYQKVKSQGKGRETAVTRTGVWGNRLMDNSLTQQEETKCKKLLEFIINRQVFLFEPGHCVKLYGEHHDVKTLVKF